MLERSVEVQDEENTQTLRGRDGGICSSDWGYVSGGTTTFQLPCHSVSCSRSLSVRGGPKATSTYIEYGGRKEDDKTFKICDVWAPIPHSVACAADVGHVERYHPQQLGCRIEGYGKGGWGSRPEGR